MIYKARDTRLGRTVALKFLTHEQRICTVVDVGEHDGRPFIVIERLAGQALKDRSEGKSLETERIAERQLKVTSPPRLPWHATPRR